MSINIQEIFTLSDSSTDQKTSTIGEPNVASDGLRFFVTGNWFAARSSDGGTTWQHVSPYTVLPPVDDGFCCDQTTIYVGSRDIFIWVLQYAKAIGGTNTLRVAVNSSASLDDDAWIWWDFKPQHVNPTWTNEWFDYNHVATSDNFLYVGTNMFTVVNPIDEPTRHVVFRFPLDALASGSPLDYDYLDVGANEGFSLRCVQEADDTMYLGCHAGTTSSLRVFSWREDSDTATQNDVQITPWTQGLTYVVAPGPDGRNWLARTDGRITGAAVTNGILTFAWSANARDPRPLPHVRVVQIDSSNMQLTSDHAIWNEKHAYAYPALSSNQSGVLGISMFTGGDTLHPSHVVGAFDDVEKKWKLRITRKGTHGPDRNMIGDYLGIAQASEMSDSWIAAGYTFQGGSSRYDVEPLIALFNYSP